MGDWIFFCAVLLVLLFGCAQVTAALIQQVPSNQERLMALETWRQQHQVDDNKQFTDIEALQKAHSADMLATSTRITTLEVEFVNVDAELTNIIHILIAVAGAVMLQLAHLAWSIVKKKPALIVEKIDTAIAKHRHGD